MVFLREELKAQGKLKEKSNFFRAVFENVHWLENVGNWHQNVEKSLVDFGQYGFATFIHASSERMCERERERGNSK